MKINELTDGLSKLEAVEADAKELIEKLTVDRAKKEKEVSDKQRVILGAKATLNSLMNMAEKYDGYGNAVKRIMEHKKEETGIIGVVADIIKVKPKYETAVMWSPTKRLLQSEPLPGLKKINLEGQLFSLLML